MTAAGTQFRKDIAAREAGVRKMYGKIVTSTSGTISSSSCKGFTVTKTSTKTGRYTVTLDRTYNKLLAVNVAVQGTADAAYTSAKGLVWFLRGVDVAPTSASTHLFYIQFCDADGSPADAELEDAAAVYLEITVKDSSVY